MIIDASHPEETRVVVLKGNRVEEFDFESANKKPLRGNIYLAKVTRVEPSLQAAFIDYGGNRHGFLAFSEIHPDYYQIPVADRQALLDEEARSHREDEDEPSGERRSRRHRRGRAAEAEMRAAGDERVVEAGAGREPTSADRRRGRRASDRRRPPTPLPAYDAAPTPRRRPLPPRPRPAEESAATEPDPAPERRADRRIDRRAQRSPNRSRRSPKPVADEAAPAPAASDRPPRSTSDDDEEEDEEVTTLGGGGRGDRGARAAPQQRRRRRRGGRADRRRRDRRGAAPRAAPAPPVQDPGSHQAPPGAAGAGGQGGARQQGRGADHLSVARRPLFRADAQHRARRRHFAQDHQRPGPQPPEGDRRRARGAGGHGRHPAHRRRLAHQGRRSSATSNICCACGRRCARRRCPRARRRWSTRRAR